VAVSDADGVPDGTVIAEDLRGYLAGERVLRHAEVVVARVADASDRAGPDSE
jgi:molecular chaperone GrpE (heat shock protein)